MSPADVVLLAANAVYGTSYVAMRFAVDDVGPITLAFLRLAIASAILVPVCLASRTAGQTPHSRGDRRTFFWMGFVGFTLALALSHWGLRWSTATNAALLIATEPVALVALAPLVLGERLTAREGWGTALALTGATIVVVNGVPGLTVALAPHWRGDVLLLLSGVCFAAYSLLGRPVLARHRSLTVTTWSFVWGLATTAPLVALEWQAARPPLWTPLGVGAVLYLGVVITGLGYLVWNWALERVSAARAAIFLNLQPLVGTLLGVTWLGEPFTLFTASGGFLIVAGLSLALTGRPAPR
ncbi:MAG TPA: DMT family transporter [Methylomirabilota bacterium]|nr:DMT family transporter [Methylomirabilota bacterium]